MSHLAPDDRAVSEALSFALVFGLVIGSIAIVYTFGLGGLADARDHERINNAERAFEVLGENLDDIVLEGAPSRSTQIRMADATLSVEEAAYLQISGKDPDTGDEYYLPTYQLRSVSFSTDDSSVKYVGGAVIRADAGGDGVMTRDPPFVFDSSGSGPNRSAIQIVRLSSAGSVAVSGDRVVQVRTERTLRTDAVVERRSFGSVQLNVSTSTPGPWLRYFESEGLDCQDPQPGAGEDGLTLVTCEYEDVERHSVVVVGIDVAFE
ncbi:MAG: hypothetical protein V5A46_09740 [Haloferacaceae archaeon]